ncbi:hypothetical protein HHK36_020466 [Tetracentron sinense]|uniref:NECAP PHear domain-containing protein n=1 Tax=Tetracentron sinense TaxID=13715 RepID=A0A834YRR5_TETSI|nr:hypothetical protein HHK36_020466 [Tetracentron sinense]
MSIEEEEAFEHTLLVVREVTIYKIPPRSTSGGYKCGEWLQSDKIWSGRLRVVSCSERCEIRLEDPNSGELFAACFVLPGQRENSVETVLDSSRYFVLKIEDGRGKHAFIGLGFTERNEAFDFNVALSDHEKYVKREHEKEVGEANDDSHIDIHPAVNHRLKDFMGFVIQRYNIHVSVEFNLDALFGGLVIYFKGPKVEEGQSSLDEYDNLDEVADKDDQLNIDFIGGISYPQKMQMEASNFGTIVLEGETIRINVKNKSASGTGMLSSAGVSGGVSCSAKPKTLGLAPPPSGAGKIRSPLPPPPNDPAAARITSGTQVVGLKENAKRTTDPFSDISQLERSLPSTTGSGSTKSNASGWAAF